MLSFLFLLHLVLLSPFNTSSVTVTLSLAMKLNHTVVATLMNGAPVVAWLCPMAKAMIYFL
jgi:hypothetical protein